MSYIAGSFLILGAALVAGFAWYERTHPTSRRWGGSRSRRSRT